MITDDSTRRDWEEIIDRTLNGDRASARYILLRSEQLVGAALMVYVRTDILDRISNVEARTCKVGK